MSFSCPVIDEHGEPKLRHATLAHGIGSKAWVPRAALGPPHIGTYVRVHASTWETDRSCATHSRKDARARPQC
eukprot:2077177-Pleurochrysis_carterae.AAC.1